MFEGFRLSLKWVRLPWFLMHLVLALWPFVYITLFNSYHPFHDDNKSTLLHPSYSA
jgi:hypothetical protein